MATQKRTIILGAVDNASLVFDRAAKRISGFLREAQPESRKTGEKVLERTLASPHRLVGAGFEAISMGLQAMIVDQIGQALSRSTEKLVEMKAQLREGKVNAADLVMPAAPVAMTMRVVVIM